MKVLVAVKYSNRMLIVDYFELNHRFRFMTLPVAADAVVAVAAAAHCSVVVNQFLLLWLLQTEPIV